MKKLTQKEEILAMKFVEIGSASDAYRRAYKTDNMAQGTLHQEACRVLARPHVTARVNELKEAAAERNKITVDRLVQELASISLVDPSEMFDEHNQLKKIKDLPKHVRIAIKEIKQLPNGEIEYKLHDKPKTLDMLMKFTGGYKIDNNQKQINIPTHKELYGDNNGQ